MRSEVPFGQQIPRLPAPNIPSVAPKGYFDRRSPPETLPLCCRTLERWIQNPRKLRETTRFRIHGIVKRCCRDRPTDRQQPAPHVVCSLAVRSAVHTRLRCRACPGVLDPLATAARRSVSSLRPPGSVPVPIRGADGFVCPSAVFWSL